MSDPIELLVILDADAQVSVDEFRHLLPNERRRHVELRLSQCGAPLPPKVLGKERPAPDWDALCPAVHQLGARVLAEIEKAEADAAVHLYVAGRAPLPLFLQLGHELPRLVISRATTTLINPRRGGPWEAYPLSNGPAGGTSFFDVATGLGESRPNSGTAVVAVFLSTIGAPAVDEPILDYVRGQGAQLSALVEIRSNGPKDLTPELAAAVGEEVHARLSQVSAHYPNARALAIFVAGPATLAFMVGQARNRQVVNQPLWIANFGRGQYDHAVTLPYGDALSVLRDEAADREARRQVLDAIIDGIDDLRTSLQDSDFPVWSSPASRRGWLSYLRGLDVERAPQGDSFHLSLIHRRLVLGTRLLEALRACLDPGATGDPEFLPSFGQLLLLHELFHDEQSLRSSNHVDVGRGGVVLEEVDFAADAFAIATLILWNLRRGGEIAIREGGRIAQRWVQRALRGMQAFDEHEQGPMIRRISERRLRRYLIWHLQAARAGAIPNGEKKLETVRGPIEDCFGQRLAVEVAPLTGFLDPRFEKMVDVALPQSEFFASLDGRLVRLQSGPNFKPADLVEQVRRFERPAIARQMTFVVEEHRAVMLPWTLAP